MGLNIVICPDSFKGSLSSPAVADAMAQGVRTVAPDARIECVPMADGGEGTAERITQALDGEWRCDRVHGPDGATVEASWGWIPAQHMAVIEVASACGLNLTAPQRRNPRQFDTRGVGELLRCALDIGAQKLVIGLGGSGTNDAGAGMLSALGGILFTGLNGQADSRLGMTYELTAITAAVVGGCSLAGGVGSIRGTVLGLVLIQTVIKGTGIVVKGIDSTQIEGLVLGTVVVLAVGFNQRFRNARA